VELLQGAAVRMSAETLPEERGMEVGGFEVVFTLPVRPERQVLLHSLKQFRVILPPNRQIEVQPGMPSEGFLKG
jgi:hypothetical protein